MKWFNGECYRYDIAKVPDCKTELRLSAAQTVFCQGENDHFDDYELYSTWGPTHYVQRLTTEIDKQIICEILKICD